MIHEISILCTIIIFLCLFNFFSCKFLLENIIRLGPVLLAIKYNYTVATTDSWKNKYYTLFKNVYVTLSAQ